MGAYRVNHSYRSNGYGPYDTDVVVELDDAVAEWVNRDSPGCLTPLDTPTTDTVADVPVSETVDYTVDTDETDDSDDSGAGEPGDEDAAEVPAGDEPPVDGEIASQVGRGRRRGGAGRGA